jgi:hypothetical protein
MDGDPRFALGYNPLMGGEFGMNLPNTGPEGMDLGQVLFPGGAPNKIQHGGGLLKMGAGGGLPFTGPGGMDIGQALFPNGAPRKIQHGRGLTNPGRS